MLASRRSRARPGTGVDRWLLLLQPVWRAAPEGHRPPRNQIPSPTRTSTAGQQAFGWEWPKGQRALTPSAPTPAVSQPGCHHRCRPRRQRRHSTAVASQGATTPYTPPLAHRSAVLSCVLLLCFSAVMSFACPLSLHPFILPPVHLSVFLSMCVRARARVPLSLLCLSVSVSLSLSLSLSLSVSLSLSLSLCVRVCERVFVFAHVHCLSISLSALLDRARFVASPNRHRHRLRLSQPPPSLLRPRPNDFG